MWQYTGVGSWEEIVNWCQVTFGAENVYARWETIVFMCEKDYTTFLLKWT